MLYEFTIKVPQDEIMEVMEKLNSANLYNLYYEQPIEIEKVQNGYGYKTDKEALIDLKIYGDEEEVENLPESYLLLIAQALHIKADDIPYQKIDNSSWDFALEDVDLENGWVISYSNDKESYGDKQVLRFEPQAAFGTGLHFTTQNCLKLILEQDLTGKKILDLGTGSGILTIGASLKGANEVVAIDYEPVEREVLLNAKINQLSNEIQVLQEDLMAGEFLIEDSYDLIIINIGADETEKIVKRHDLLVKSKEFIISGIVEWNVEKVLDMFTNADFNIEKQAQTEEWVTIHFKSLH